MTTTDLAVVRLGIIGLGSVFEPYAALMRELIYEERLEVVATCDTEPGREQRVRRFLRRDVPFTTDYRDVLDRDDVDAVIVLTSMAGHGEIATAALAAGKHVLVEKPMAVSLDDAAALVAQAESGSQLLVCAPHVVLSPTYQALWKRVVDDGEIGPVLSARARYGWAGPDWGKWYYRTGGGPLFDLGVYNITSLTGLMGPVQRVTAMAGIAIPERLVEGERIQVEDYDNYQILLDFGDARFAVVTTGFTMQDYRSPAIELYGERGVAQMLGDDWAPQGYEIARVRQAGLDPVCRGGVELAVDGRAPPPGRLPGRRRRSADPTEPRLPLPRGDGEGQAGGGDRLGPVDREHRRARSLPARRDLRPAGRQGGPRRQDPSRRRAPVGRRPGRTAVGDPDPRRDLVGDEPFRKVIAVGDGHLGVQPLGHVDGADQRM